MKFPRWVTLAALVAVTLTVAAYLSTRKQNLQAGVSVYAPRGSVYSDLLLVQKSVLSKACPNEAFFEGRDTPADYELETFWDDDGWYVRLRRKDGAILNTNFFDKPDKDAARVARQICRAIEKDFPLWVNTQREMASMGKPEQAGATTAAQDVDPPRRYEMMEYRNGPIVGQALLDTKLGRLWALTNIVNSAGKTERSEFKEISVENLWETEDEAYDRVDKAHSDDDRKFWTRDERKLSRVKQLTRPTAIEHAEEQVEKEAP